MEGQQSPQPGRCHCPGPLRWGSPVWAMLGLQAPGQGPQAQAGWHPREQHNRTNRCQSFGTAQAGPAGQFMPQKDSFPRGSWKEKWNTYLRTNFTPYPGLRPVSEQGPSGSWLLSFLMSKIAEMKMAQGLLLQEGAPMTGYRFWELKPVWPPSRSGTKGKRWFWRQFYQQCSRQVAP